MAKKKAVKKKAKAKPKTKNQYVFAVHDTSGTYHGNMRITTHNTLSELTQDIVDWAEMLSEGDGDAELIARQIELAIEERDVDKLYNCIEELVEYAWQVEAWGVYQADVGDDVFAPWSKT